MTGGGGGLSSSGSPAGEFSPSPGGVVFGAGRPSSSGELFLGSLDVRVGIGVGNGVGLGVGTGGR